MNAATPTAYLEELDLSFMAVLDYEEWDAGEVVDSILDAGFDSVEWSMSHVDSLRAPASALACQQDLVTGGEAAVEASLLAIDAAAEAGVPVVNVLTGPNLWEPGAKPSAGDDATWTRVLLALELIFERGQAAGVKVALEPCWGTLAHDAATARRVLDAVPVSVNFDPSHFVMTGDSIPDLIREWGSRIVHFHLKDAFGKPGVEGEDFIFCLLGEGAVPWPETFTALSDIDYKGALSVEFEAYRYYEQVLASDPAAAARLSFGQVMALIGCSR